MAWVQTFVLIAKYNAELLTAQGADEKEKRATGLLGQWSLNLSPCFHGLVTVYLPIVLIE
jgi:hypothetical protein